MLKSTELPEATEEFEVQRLAVQEAQRPFDLTQDLLLRTTLLRLNREEHVLLLTMHHIVSDAWSMKVLSGELLALYEAFDEDKTVQLLNLSIQYADFAVWQREWLQAERLESQLAYWKQQLGGSLSVLNLPTDHPRPAVQTFQGVRHTLALSRELAAKLKALSRQENATLFMTLLVAFKVLLYRYSGQPDIVVGSPIANRNRSEIEGLIGFFVNTLVLRTDLSGNPTVRELLGRVREITLGAYAHQDMPFEKLVKELQPERDLSRNPLFQVMFAFADTENQFLKLPGLRINPLEVDPGTAKFDLTLSLTEDADSLRGWFEYNTDLFTAATIKRMAGHFQTLLEGIVANPDVAISLLPLLTETERHQILVEWNNTTIDYPQEQCIHQLFEAQVERTPDAVAVVFEDKKLTYQELNRQANQLAHYMREHGVGPDVLVGICMERSLEMVVGLMGILKAGGAYVPLDPEYPKDRVAFMLEDTQALLMLTQQQLVKDLPETDTTLLCLDADWKAIAKERTGNLDTTAGPDNLAYVIYTSGSTGKPKGVMIPHRGLFNYLSWCIEAYSVAEGRSAPVHSSIGFDLTITSLFSPLLVGKRVILLPEDHGVEQLSHVLHAGDNFSLIKITPSHLEILGQSLAVAGTAERIKALIIGGEALFADTLLYWRTHSPGTRIINEYGPTETVVGCCVYEVLQEDALSRAVPIGRPVANTQVYLLDNNLQPVPIGVPGELYIGGAGLAQGYLNRPELTAERFICNPFNQESGVRLYKTGDKARYLPDGNIEFLGRIDHQVKIRGFRIEPGEIETILGEHPLVQEAVVIAREDRPGDKRLVAYVVCVKGQTPIVSDFRAFLQQKLPRYMIPSVFVTLDTLPLTFNGKIDRKALPAPDQARPELSETFIAPRTSVEKTLAIIWTQILNLNQVGVHDNFFDLGGDSILSLQIIARANQAGFKLTPKQLFQHQTIAQLATVADIAKPLQNEQSVVTGPVQLTPIQHWFFEQELPDPYHWNMTMLLEVQPKLDPALLEQAVHQILLHHDALRLRFESKGSNWQQVNAGPDESVAFSQINLSKLSGVEQGPAIEATAAQLQTSLNLSTGPLLQVALFNLGGHKPDRLLIIAHHLVIDGVSWRILLEDLQTAYQQLHQGEAVQLPLKTTSFKHWAERLTDYARLKVLRQELDYWLADSRTQISRLPVDYPEGDGANTVASAHAVGVSLDVAETRALLHEVPKAYRTRINDVLLTALLQAFARWTGVYALLVDLEGHGREEIFEDIDLSRTVGWFTTIFPVLLKLEKTDNLGEVLKSVKEQLRFIPNRGIGYGLLHYLDGDKTVVERLRTLPKAEVSFNYLGQFDQVLAKNSFFRLAQESYGPNRNLQGHRSHMLAIDGRVIERRLQLAFTYSKNLHRHTTIESLAQNFIESLHALMTHCQSPNAVGYTPSDFPLTKLYQQELDKVIAKFSKSGKA